MDDTPRQRGSEFFGVRRIFSVPLCLGVSLSRDGVLGPHRLNNMHPSGGTTTQTEWLKPWAGVSSAITPPPLPMLLPPYISASLFSSSRYQPPSGTPIR